MKDIGKILKMASLFEALAAAMPISEAEKILGLHHGNYDNDSLSKTYKRKVFLFHPDVNKSPDATEQMKKINVAFETLKHELSFTRHVPVENYSYEPIRNENKEKSSRRRRTRRLRRHRRPRPPGTLRRRRSRMRPRRYRPAPRPSAPTPRRTLRPRLLRRHPLRRSANRRRAHPPGAPSATVPSGAPLSIKFRSNWTSNSQPGSEAMAPVSTAAKPHFIEHVAFISFLFMSSTRCLRTAARRRHRRNAHRPKAPE